MLLARFEKCLQEQQLVAPGQTVVVAVSGGVDSMVLLDLFARIREPWRLQLVVAHLNHGLRGKEADRDQSFVSARAGDYGLPVVIERADVASYARQRHLSREAAAREVRYDFLRRAAQQLRAHRVALGHHANDQAETFLDHLLRGAGLAGLGGMWWQREIFVRPLLGFTRGELTEYATQHQLPFCEDSSNTDLRIRRNRLRHELLPLLATHYNPRVVEALSRACQAFQEADQGLRIIAAQQLTRDSREEGGKIVLDIAEFLRYLSVTQKYVLMEVVERMGGGRSQLDSRTLERVLRLVRQRRPGTRVSLGHGIEAAVSGRYLVIGPSAQGPFSLPVHIGREVVDPARGFVFKCSPAAWEEFQALRGTSPVLEFVDAGEVRGPLRLRSWQRGDRFFPLGMQESKKLSDFFIDAKVPHHRRHLVPLLECDKGIIWVCGLRLDERFRVTDKTKQVLKLEFQGGYASKEREAEG
ncbi:MAG: tRNA lysidine(34) synthetase TilS [Calditrichaeota bacterium]|nr:tRNA lysidine(34) synthetase TilS [Calditrichota bacterium]